MQHLFQSFLNWIDYNLRLTRWHSFDLGIEKSKIWFWQGQVKRLLFLHFKNVIKLQFLKWCHKRWFRGNNAFSMISLSAKHFWQKKQVDHRKGAATPGHLRILILNTPIRYSPLFTVLFLLLLFTPIVSDIPHFRYMWSRLWNPVKSQSERFHIISGFYSCITDNPQSGIAADAIRKNRMFLTYFGCTLISQNSLVFFLKRMRT